MKVFENFKAYLLGMTQEFWLYNYAASVLFYFLGSRHILLLVLFPVALVMIQYLMDNYVKEAPAEVREYLGFYPYKQDIKWVIITLIASFIIRELSIAIVILGLAYIWYRENNHSQTPRP